MKIIECDIKQFNKDGHGIGFHNDIPVEILHTMPGDRASVQILRKSRGHYITKKLELLESSPQRIKPQCPHFENCGGCRWQHMPYELQIQIKEKIVYDLFGQHNPMIPCSPPWYYRNKMEFSFSQNKKGTKFLGLIIPRTKGMVADLYECHLCPPEFMETLSLAREWWHNNDLTAYHAPKNYGSLRHLTLRPGLMMLTVSGNPEFALTQQHIDSFKEINPNLSTYLQIQQLIKGKPTQFYEMHLTGPEYTTQKINGCTFKISPTAFFQPNTLQAEKLYQAALNLAQISKNNTVWDLYCGSATLGICASKYAKEVIGIEIVPESILDAKRNIYNNDIENVKVFEGDVGTILKEQNLAPPDIIIVDPPRAGLDKNAIAEILKANPQKIIYISCNPKTQAENISQLHNYKLKNIQPVDMFPMTPHIENVAFLELGL